LAQVCGGKGSHVDAMALKFSLSYNLLSGLLLTETKLSTVGGLEYVSCHAVVP